LVREIKVDIIPSKTYIPISLLLLIIVKIILKVNGLRVCEMLPSILASEIKKP
jgi:hypothetical protein